MEFQNHMANLFQRIWRAPKWELETDTTPLRPGMIETAKATQVSELDIAADDPLLSHLLSPSGVIDVEKLTIDSPTLLQLKEAGVKMAIPLVSQGELIGLLNLGARRSEQDYSTDDRRLLQTLATQAAPALRVAQLARQQLAEARQRERIEQELRVARVIQQTLLPKELPSLDGWRISAHWQPASAVGGDFYDFIHFPDGRIGLIVADVTDKGIPAAMVMATARGILRAAAEALIAPGYVLERANNQLCPDIPPNMFITCLYAVLDPSSGHLCCANAGHNLPYLRGEGGVSEIRVRGMPLGLMPGMPYEEVEMDLLPGDNLILYSDGLVEAHNPQGEIFGFPRLQQLLELPECSPALIDCMLDDLHNFTGSNWEQEDDVTLVTLDRFPVSHSKRIEDIIMSEMDWQLLAEFSVPSQPGNERQVMQKVAEIVEPFGFDTSQLERLKTAVAETTMNAIEYGNRFQADLPAMIKVLESADALAVQIIDYGGGSPIPEPEIPDLEAKLDGLQSPRGWGIFLIKNMVDEMRVSTDGEHHIVELIFKKGGER